MTGRVFGIQSTILSAVMLIAPPLGGMLVQQYGASDIFATVGWIVGILGAIGLIFGRRLWQLPSAP